MTVEQATDRSTGLRDLAWKVWPFLNWGFPLLLLVRVFAGGGWEALLLAFASPVVVPALGLLGSLPRFLLRRKGVRSAPAPLVWLLILHWWFWLAFILLFPSTGDSGPLPSFLGTVAPVPLTRDFENGLFLVCLLLALATWIAALIVAATHAGRPLPLSPGRGWDTAAWIAAVATPIALVLAVVAGAMATAAIRDAAGETASEALGLPITEQAARAEARYAEAQAMLTPLREALAPTEWEPIDSGFSPYDVCSGGAGECYDFDVAYRVADATGGAGLEELAELLRADGWTVSEGNFGLSAENADGYVVSALMPTAGGASLDLDTPNWFGDASEIRAALGPDPGRGPSSYDADEWPPLR